MSSLSFFIPCQPPTVTSQQKRACRVGNGIRFFKSSRQKSAEASLWALLQPYAPDKPMEGPLTLVLKFYFPWRKTEKKRIVKAHSFYPCSVRPDLDNLSKAVLDVMTGLRFFNDDGQISSLCLHKEYSDMPGISVNLTQSLATNRGGEIVSIV